MDTSFFFSFLLFGKYFTINSTPLSGLKLILLCLNRFNRDGEGEKEEGGGRFVFNYGQLFAIEKEEKRKRKKNIIIVVLGIISRPRYDLFRLSSWNQNGDALFLWKNYVPT